MKSGSRSVAFATSSTASCAAQVARSSPRYAVKAFCPHGTRLGATMGEKAETLP